MSAISTLSSFLQNLSLVQNEQNQIAKLTYQVDTGLKSEDLQGYGTQANLLLNLQSSQATEQNYVSNNTQTNTYLTAYDTTLGQLSGDATKLVGALDAFTVTDPTAVSDLKALVNGLQVDVAATLNSQVGGRFLYGGTRYTTQPVGDLSTLPTPAIVPPVPPSTAPTVTPLTVAQVPLPSPQTTPATLPLPPYDTQASTLNSATPTAAQLTAAGQTYQTQTTAVANNQQVSYGISSNNVAFQHLVYALQCAQAATTSTGANQQAYIQQASDEIQAALTGTPGTSETGIQGLQDTNGTAETLVANANTVHNQTLATLQSQITTITQVDPATVAAELSQAQTQLEGSYKVVSSVLNETLLNYLK
jgi:flagellar hook-associated protein 3 FlgL